MARHVGSGTNDHHATRPALAAEQRPVALPLAASRLPTDLFAFLPGSAWEVSGTRLEREATYQGARCSLIAETFRETSCGQTGVSLGRSYLSCFTEAGFAEIPVGNGLSAVLDEFAQNAVDELQGELNTACNELWDDR